MSRPVPGRWGRWGDSPELSGAIRGYLREQVGPAEPWPMRSPDLSAVAASRCDPVALSELVDIVGEDHVDTSAFGRWACGGGASYSDYVRLRGGDITGIPDAVIAPADHEQVLAVLATCSQHDVSVVPMGGGTSVVGGLRCERPHIVVSTRRMRSVVDIDDLSGLVRAEAGITGPMLEAILAPRGLTLGHLPQSWQRASLGGYLATRSAGQASTGYGRSDDMVESVVLATPSGSLSAGHVPTSAAGPDLLHLVVGSEGTLGIITQAQLRVRRRPTARRYEAWVFPDFAAGREAFRSLAQARASADVMRLSDAHETATTLLMSVPGGVLTTALNAYLNRRGVPRESACMAILGWEGDDSGIVSTRRRWAEDVLGRHGAVYLGQRPGSAWLRHRFDGPHLRDSLLDAGYLVETVETAATWSALEHVGTAVHDALTNALTSDTTRPYVMTHISHVYETGASLYTTVIAVADRSHPIRQWQRAKIAVTDAIVDSGGTITHHHAVGRDHAPWLEREIGQLGVQALRAVKSTVDPRGICNPGVLGLA
jgi:alkyldihydroxyacetonephosphate synthase